MNGRRAATRRPAVISAEGWLPVVAAALLAVALGYALPRAPALAIGGVAVVAVVVGVTRAGLTSLLTFSFALLPWMVIFSTLLPNQSGTMVTAAAVGLLFVLSMPLRFARQSKVILGATIFIAIVLAHAIFATRGAQFIQAAKILLFPVMAIAVLSEDGRALLAERRTVLVRSGLLAMVVHLGVIGAGLGDTGGYYGIGEKLGYAYPPHELALLCVVVAGGGLASARGTLQQALFFGLGAVPAALTGVRSALLGAIVVLIIFVIQNRISPRALLIPPVVVALAFVTGAADTVVRRFHRDPNDFSSGLAAAGSGRGAIWMTALSNWVASGPLAWLFGTGLDSINQFELKDLGEALVGHSDLVEVLVQLGIVGFAAWLMIWAALMRGGLRTLVLVPIAVYAVVNGSIEYVAPLTFGMALSAACIAPVGTARGSARPAARRRLARA